ncbi:MAG: response regulator [Chloroflexi bacterium]|uniref:response regulator n=1 Tax=Candidatus Flexifilum breve TaxID=3140694 RepID=UPI003136BFD6|nr:response regulator [Chloroflexota bacterium]MBK9746053.1 response regulator [Chloroflexota bacterium]
MHSKPHILYVEDEIRSRRVMQMITSDLDLPAVTLFEDSTDFLERVLALSPKPDLIFLDIHMKPYTGFQLLEMLRASGGFETIPIVAMTASVMNEEIQALRTAGFDGCIAKPIDFDSFPEILNRIMSGEKVWRILG